MLHPFQDVLAAFQAGKMVVMVDDADRENEGDLVLATEFVTPEAISFMMREARGLICVSVGNEVAERLQLPFQSTVNGSSFQTPFTVSVDAQEVAENGVTARGRAATLRKLLDPHARPEDFITPGHTFPLIASPLGVLGRRGQTEGSYDLARLAGLSASGVICEILNPDGTMARGERLQAFAERHGLLVTSVAEVAQYRLHHEVLVREVARTSVESPLGTFDAYVFADDASKGEHLALVYGDIGHVSVPLVRLHSECLTGDVFGSRRCDCGPQLGRAMELIVAEGAGVILYLRQEGRGIGLANKMKAYALQDQGHDTVDANLALGFAPDLRDFAVAAKMLRVLGVQSLRLLTNNPAKVRALSDCGLRVEERVPLVVPVDEQAKAYLDAKKLRLGHLL